MTKQEEIKQPMAVATVIYHIHDYRQYTGGVYCTLCGEELKEWQLEKR